MLYIVLFFISFFMTYFIKNYAIKKSLMAQVNERSSHSHPTPHGGGIALIITWFLGLTYLYISSDLEDGLYFALMAGLIISAVSLVDDIIELSSKIRILMHTVVSILGLYFLGGFSELNLLFFTIQNQIIINIFAFFMVIWFINLYNFLDGLDGYAGSEAIFLALAGFILFGDEHFLVLIVSALGFLVWNWHKAKIFMGDVGSTLLGYNIAIFTIYYSNQNSMDFWIWIILFSVFWFDATFTLYRRYRNKEKLSQAHKKHIYQRLHQSGWTHSRVVIMAMFINVLFFLLVYSIPSLLVNFIITVIILLFISSFVDKRKGFF